MEEVAIPEEVDEAQTVLLDGMEGAQYITIQRADPENLGKGVPLFTLNGEIISDGMVVDMINGVGADYSTGTQFYETDDVLPHVLTEEDRRLAAALVAVQLQQQQKQHQLHLQSNQDESTMQNSGQLDNIAPVNTYSIQTIQDPNPPLVYPSIQNFRRSAQSMKTEFINVKCEEDVDISAESSEDAVPTPGLKRSLPHKKRIPRKLKQQSKKGGNKKDGTRTNQEGVIADISKMQGNLFKCELCGSKYNGQLKFFEHLKSHYEPFKEEKKNTLQSVNNNIGINTVNPSVQDGVEEFSEPEDLMEGIRDVVEETGAQIDDDYDDDGNDLVEEDPLPESNNDSTIWTMADVEGNIEQVVLEEPSTINQEHLYERNDSKPSGPNKKKKAKLKKSVEELTCPSCGRTFHHKNSLVYHMRSHSGERPHQCDVCGKSFFAASALKVHKRLHSGDKPYKCEECGRHFRQWGDLKYHSTSLHSEQRQFQCEYCGKDFARKYSLIVHRRIHTGEKNYRCEYCNKTFRASSYLQNHRRIHTGEKPHPCEVCGKPFRVRSDMKRHMLTHSRAASRVDRTQKNSTIKLQTDERSNGSIDEAIDKRNRTINEIVHELKLEVEPSSNGTGLAVTTEVVTLATRDPGISESILPHVGIQNLGYVTQVEGSDSANNRDPLDSATRTNETLNFDMQLYSINM